MVSLIVSPLSGMKITSLMAVIDFIRISSSFEASFMLLATAIAMELFILVTDGERFDTNSLLSKMSLQFIDQRVIIFTRLV